MYDYKKLTVYGIIGAIILFIWYLIAVILGSIIDNSGFHTILNVVGLVLGILYLVLGVFVIITVVKSQEGSLWGLFLAAGIVALFTPLGWFGVGGLVASTIAGALFAVYYFIEGK